MIFGKHINRYYLKFSVMLLLGLAALIMVDYLQLIIPNLYQMVINGTSLGYVMLDGVQTPFTLDLLLDEICMPLVGIILSVVVGRFIWRACFFGAAIKVEEDLRNRMFDNAKNLSREYYQVNKVGNLMSLFTNDLDTVQECYGWGIMMFCDAVFIGILAVSKMWKMDPLMTVLSMIPMVFLMVAATVVGNYLTKKWDYRQECYSRLSDFAQESYSGIAVIKAFVKEGKELWAFKELNVENEKANMDHTKASVLFRVMVMLFVESVICIILGYGGYLVYKGSFNAGQLVEFIGYFNSVIWPIMSVSELIDMSSRGKASLLRIGELLDAKQLIAALYGGIVMGAGYGLIFRAGGTSGGVDIIAKWMNKQKDIPIGTTNLIANAIVIVGSALIYGNLDSALYAMITSYLTSMVIDKMIYGMDAQKSAMIITSKPKEVAGAVMAELHRGCTGMDATGMYTGGKRTVLICAVRRHETGTLKKLILEQDERAFMLISNISEVFGTNFKRLGQ